MSAQTTSPGDGTAWASLRERVAWVRRFRKLVAAEQDRLAEAIRADVAKPYFEALTADILPLIAACRWLERRAGGLLREKRVRGGGPLFLGQSHRVQRAPLGRVAIIATWNYPVQLLGIQLAQALVAGNRVVVKPSEHSPTSQLFLLTLARQAGLPDGVLGSTEPTRDAGAELLRDHRFDHVVFTGSTEVGRAIAGTLAQTLTPSTLELSGRDSALVLSDADPDLAATSIAAAMTANAGQTCMAPKRAIVARTQREAFLAALEQRLERVLPRELISPEAAHRAWSQAKAAIDAGGSPVGHVPPEPAGRTLVPIVVSSCPVASALARGENFGPVLAVIDADDDTHALELHGRFEQRLATAVYTRNPRRVRGFAAALGSSIVTVNDAVIPVAHPGVSLGGRGPSGWGHSRGREGLLAMTRPVFCSVTSAKVRPPADAPDEARARQAGRWIGKLYGRGVPPPTMRFEDPSGLNRASAGRPGPKSADHSVHARADTASRATP